MPIHVYPSNDVVQSELAVLKQASGTCYSPGSFSTNTTSSQVRSISREHATGWRMHGWNKMRNAGAILPFTPWYKFRLNVEAQLGFREWCAGTSSSRFRWDNFYRGGASLDLSSDTLMGYVDLSDLDFYVQKAAASIYSGGFDALTFLAEAHSLRRMFSGIVGTLRHLTDRKNLTLKKASDYWLEGRYGWRTLKYDIVDLYNAILSANERRTRYRKATGTSVNGSTSSYSTSTSSGLITGTSTEISWSGSLRGTVVADIEVPGFRFNPVLTYWEVVRLSFVFDWLFNVGQALEAASFLLFTKAYQAGSGYKVDFNLNTTITSAGHTGSTIVFADSGSASGTATVIKRSPSTVSFIPKVKLRLDEYKAVDLLALIWQRLAKRR